MASFWASSGQWSFQHNRQQQSSRQPACLDRKTTLRLSRFSAPHSSQAQLSSSFDALLVTHRYDGKDKNHLLLGVE